MCAIKINNLGWIMSTGVAGKYSMIKNEWECLEMYKINILQAPRKVGWQFSNTQ